MSTHIRLADLTDKALALLKAQGLSASTLGGYTKKYEFLKKYFASHNTAYYDEGLLSRLMQDYEEKHKNGTICYFYLRQWQRATRLIKEIAAEGTADLTPYVNRRKYVVSKENKAVINSILDSYNLQGIPREEMDISLRHTLHNELVEKRKVEQQEKRRKEREAVQKKNAIKRQAREKQKKLEDQYKGPYEIAVMNNDTQRMKEIESIVGYAPGRKGPGSGSSKAYSLDQQRKAEEEARQAAIDVLDEQIRVLENQLDAYRSISLVGTQVQMKNLGTGIVIEQNANVIKVRFGKVEKQYFISKKYPMRPTFEDDEVIVEAMTDYEVKQKELDALKKKRTLI